MHTMRRSLHVAVVATRAFRHRTGNVLPLARGLCASPDQQKTEASSTAQLLYRGPLAKPIRVLKKVSVVTCASSAIAAPLLLYAGSETVPVAAQAAFSGLVLLAGWGSTGLLHYFTTGYCHKLEAEAVAGADADTDAEASKKTTTRQYADDDMLTAHLLTFFARPRQARFRVGATTALVDHWNPLVSFEAELESGERKRLFVQGEHFEDKKLLRKLLARPLDEDERKFTEFDVPDWAKDEA